MTTRALMIDDKETLCELVRGKEDCKGCCIDIGPMPCPRDDSSRLLCRGDFIWSPVATPPTAEASIPQMQVGAMLMETRREDKARIAELESDLAEARKREQELREMLAECHAYFVIRNLGSKADALQDQIAKVVNKQEGRGTL